MSRHNTIRATLAVTAAAFAFGATSAGAMPLRDGSPAVKGPHTAEYDAGHASLAAQRAQTLAKPHGIALRADLRGPDAKDAAIASGTLKADLRGPDAKDAAIASGTAGQPVFQGPPNFSTTKVSALHSVQPPLAKDDGNDVPLIGIILGLAGAGMLGAGAAFALTKTTRSRRARVVA